MKTKIDILLATYNGEKYLSEQIESIIQQTYQEWNLIIHDDGSEDGTIEIIKKYTNQYQHKIKFINDGIKTGGAKNNFAHLLNFSKAPYIMFCDQDDVWLDKKIELFMSSMQKAEKENGNIPLVVFSDLQVVDESLNIISESMMSSQRLLPWIANDFNLLKTMNVITGCAMMFNAKAREVASPISNSAVMHDWWVALIVAKYGKNIYLDSATILYRQHDGNSIGYKEFSIKKIVRDSLSFIFRKKRGYYMTKNMLESINEEISFFEYFFIKIKITFKRTFY